MRQINQRMHQNETLRLARKVRRLAAKDTVLGRGQSLVDLDWYTSWLTMKLQAISGPLRSIVVGDSPLFKPAGFNALILAVENFTSQNDGISIEEIIEHLLTTRVLSKDLTDDLSPLRTLIFAVLGWRTMLYVPALNVCSFDELAIQQKEGDIDSGLVFDTYRVSAQLSDRPLSVLLKSFGNLLPARSEASTQAASESSKSVATWTALWPQEMNAYLLQTLLRVRFRWVESLALHLDYDKSTRTLSLFAFPSICVFMLQKSDAIFAFASTETHAADPRGNQDDIRSFLQEVLLSYRLLFAQTPKAHKVFRRISSPSMMPHTAADTLLPLLCTNKHLKRDVNNEWLPEDRPVYFASKDFGVLYDRVALLAKEIENVRPQSMGDLLRDRRDKLQYWTFWLISIIGVIGILLSLTQVVLQGYQVSQQCSSG
ncbi:hypothetical protein F4860DRAFT_475714 [Xylaria cubensis]|nr:hypothetical protein F4860DRAFT_475714 [Xylaria cubensis]